MKYLSDSLKINKTVTYLDLGGNKIGDESMKYLSDYLKRDTTLTYCRFRIKFQKNFQFIFHPQKKNIKKISKSQKNQGKQNPVTKEHVVI